MNSPLVSLDQNAVKNEIEKQIALISRNPSSMTHDHKLIGAIESVTDNNLKAELLQKCLEAVQKHQGEQNEILREQIRSAIKTNEDIIKHELDKDRTRTELFNSRFLIIFLWCFPVATGFASIKYLESYAFAIFIVIVLYGVLISLYFSQANGLTATWEAFAKNNRGKL